MKRRELFAALGALFVAPAVAKEVRTVEQANIIRTFDSIKASICKASNIGELVITHELKGNDLVLTVERNGGKAINRPALPLADLANRPDDAKAIFEHIASSAYEFKSVQYTGFDQPRIILTGFSTVYGDAKVVITQSTIRYTTIKRNGQENTNDVRNQKVVEFIRGLGYEIDEL